MALGVGKELGKVVHSTGPSYSTVSTRAALQIENHAADSQQLSAKKQFFTQQTLTCTPINLL